uniref:Lipoprotein n=1 Tax=Acidobacterium capsulatum TaxID=33075 RepID=A0A7V4XU04_9BACT
MRNKLAVSLSLAFALGLMSGCAHKPITPPAPPVPAPLPPPHASTESLPNLPAPTLPNVELSLPPTPHEEAPEHRHYGHPLRRRHAVEVAPSTVAKPAAAGANTGQEPTDSTPIGRLSTAPASANQRSYANIMSEINSIQGGVQGIHRALSRSEQQTVTEIEMFLGKARNALQAGDLDGAHTLTVKAQVLLNELSH